jgi:hypothetical protein
MSLNIIIGLGFLAAFLFMVWKNYASKSQPAATPTTSAVDRFQNLLKNVPPTSAVPPAPSSPSREQAFQAAFVLIDYANAKQLPETAKAVADQLSLLAVQKGTNE